MGFMDKIKNMVSMSEEEYLDEVDVQDDEDAQEEYNSVPKSRTNYSRTSRSDTQSNKVVDMHSTDLAPAAATPAKGKAHVVFEKLDRFQDVASVADVLNEKRIVILNLETCPNEDTVRVIDFLSGVAYANSGDIKRIAGRAYIITPYNVPLTGELLDEVESHANSNLF